MRHEFPGDTTTAREGPRANGQDLGLARRLAREEGLFVGMSSGAIVWAAMGVARELGPGRRVACIAPDSGARYLSTALFVSGVHTEGGAG